MWHGVHPGRWSREDEGPAACSLGTQEQNKGTMQPKAQTDGAGGLQEDVDGGTSGRDQETEKAGI